MSLAEIERELSGVLNGRRSQNLKELKKISKLKTSSGWNVETFANSISEFFSLQMSKADEKLPSTPTREVGIQNSEERMVIEDLITGSIDVDWEKIIQPEIEEMGNQSDTDEFEIEVQDEELDRIVALLMEERSETDTRRSHKMPATNRCFQNLDILSRIQTKGVSFRQNVLDFKENSSYSLAGVLGKVISLVLREDRMHSDMTADEAEAFAQEEGSVSLMTSVRSDVKAQELSESKLEENIANIVELLKNATGYVRESLIESKQRLDRLLYIKKYPVLAESIGERMSSDFLIQCKPIIRKVSDKLNLVADMDLEFYIPIVKAELDNLVISLLDSASISPSEEPVYREAVSKPNLTTLLVDLVSELTKTSLKVGDYRTDLSGETLFSV